eukprot:scaffold1012_cov189-Alexandrium_tamarense.AAC.16
MSNSFSRESPQTASSPTTMRRSPRKIWWGGLFITSLIAMGSTFEAVRVSSFVATALYLNSQIGSSLTSPIVLLSVVCFVLLAHLPPPMTPEQPTGRFNEATTPRPPSQHPHNNGPYPPPPQPSS